MMFIKISPIPVPTITAYAAPTVKGGDHTRRDWAPRIQAAILDTPAAAAGSDGARHTACSPPFGPAGRHRARLLASKLRGFADRAGISDVVCCIGAPTV